MDRYLLDTHVLLWWLEAGERLSKGQRRILKKADPGHPLLVSCVSLMEVAGLYESRRIRLSVPLLDWLNRAVAPPLVQLCPLTPAVAAEMLNLPASFPRDPADRAIASTARVHGAILVTSDGKIAQSNAVPTLS